MTAFIAFGAGWLLILFAIACMILAVVCATRNVATEGAGVLFLSAAFMGIIGIFILSQG